MTRASSSGSSSKSTPKKAAGGARRCPEVHDSMATSRPIVPTIHKELVRRKAWGRGEVNLDLGGGRYELASQFLAKHGVTNLVADPSRGDAHNKMVWDSVRATPVQTVTCANVLNVICDRKNRQTVLKAAAGAIQHGGLVALQVYEGDRSGLGQQTPDGWQENRKAVTYMPEIERWFGKVIRKGNLFFASEPRARPVGKVPPDAGTKAGVATRARAAK